MNTIFIIDLIRHCGICRPYKNVVFVCVFISGVNICCMCLRNSKIHNNNDDSFGVFHGNLLLVASPVKGCHSGVFNKSLTRLPSKEHLRWQ